MDESRGECRQGRVVHPAELFVITTPKMLHCMDWDCRCFPYLSCKALLIRQHYNQLFLPRFAFPSKRILDQQTQFTRHFTPLLCAFGKSRQSSVWEPKCAWKPRLIPRNPELSTHHPSSGEARTKMRHATFVDLCPPPSLLSHCLGFF